MAKNLKLNIKNLQLAGALKSKKQKDEEPAQTPEKKADAKPKSRISRLREDSTVSSALNHAEKTLASRPKEKEPEELPKKRKSRLIQDPSKEKVEPVEPEVASPQPIEEETKPEEAPAETKEKDTPESLAEKPSATTSPTTPAVRPGEKPPEQRRPKDLKQQPKKKEEQKRFDSRDRQGLRDVDNEAWRKRRAYRPRRVVREEVVRPKNLALPLPISIKDLAQEMKLKASQLIAKLLMQGMTLTLNDYLDDETVVQLLGQEFGCEITIDTAEQERIQITDQTVAEEIQATPAKELILRPAVVTFMGHVDHGKTSLIDTIRESNRVAGEAGAITQHIGAFKVKTKAGDVTILDTPGHEAFFEMRSRGASVTDLVILVIAGDEGVRAQTIEAVQQAREAKVPILVALNKADKESFDAQKVYRELSDLELLPEAWGGTTIVVSCSAESKQGIPELLEMIALQAEILELRASPKARSRGTILESEMHKGFGAVATVLVQNGTLRKGDAIVFGAYSGRIKTMHNDHGAPIEIAGPSTPVKITGLSELAVAGSEFIVVKNEKEARQLASARAAGLERSLQAQAKAGSMERMLAKRESGEQKVLPIILRADVQGSLEALKNSLLKIKSDKARVEIVSADVGEISESDIELAAASKATIVGFHTRIQSFAEDLIKQKKVSVFMQDVIYHIVDEVKDRMRSLLDKLAQENEMGSAIVKTVFKSSLLGNIAGSQITDGIIKRQSLIRQIREDEVIWKGKVSSLKRVKEDVKEVQKGIECGIVLEGRSDILEGDILQAYEITYLEQDL